MLDLARCKPGLLHLVDAVVNELLAKSTQLRAEDVMVVGATCRDLLQGALGHDFALRATGDIDLGLAVSNWAAYDELTGRLPVVGNTGIVPGRERTRRPPAVRGGGESAGYGHPDRSPRTHQRLGLH